MNIELTPRLQMAINFAAESHRDQSRKNENNTPYISHPFSVVLIASKYTQDEDIIISCLLHDVVEDCGVSFEEIEQMFGSKVRNIIYHVTEPKFFGSTGNTLTWKEKKQNYLALLEVGPSESLLVATCDKIHNMSTMNSDLVHAGTFWFLDLAQAILDRRKSELPDELYSRFKDSLIKSKNTFTIITREK